MELSVICSGGIGDSFLVLGRTPINFLGNLGFRFKIFYINRNEQTYKALTPFFKTLKYCRFVDGNPSNSDRYIYQKIMGLSTHVNFLWKPPFSDLEIIHKNCNSRRKKILLHTHLGKPFGWIGYFAKHWHIDNWISLCHILYSMKYECHILEYDKEYYAALKDACPFIQSGVKNTLKATVLSFLEYDYVLSIDSWSKYVAAWYSIPQVIIIPDLRLGYVDFENINPNQIAEWWFHGIVNHKINKIIGLEKKDENYAYTLGSIDELTVNDVINEIIRLV